MKREKQVIAICGLISIIWCLLFTIQLSASELEMQPMAQDQKILFEEKHIITQSEGMSASDFADSKELMEQTENLEMEDVLSYEFTKQAARKGVYLLASAGPSIAEQPEHAFTEGEPPEIKEKSVEEKKDNANANADQLSQTTPDGNNLPETNVTSPSSKLLYTVAGVAGVAGVAALIAGGSSSDSDDTDSQSTSTTTTTTTTTSSSSSSGTSTKVINLAKLVRIGDDTDYNAHHPDQFHQSHPDGLSWSDSFSLSSLSANARVKFIYTIAASKVGNPVYVNGTYAGRVCNRGNTAWNVYTCGIDITRYVHSGGNSISVKCAIDSTDTVTPYDDIEMYNLKITVTE